MIIRTLNTIYHQAPHIKPDDEKSFLQYCILFCRGVDSHHNAEERTFFPAVEKMTGAEGIMDTNKEQHKAFHDGLHSLWNYVKACQVGDDEYDGQKILRIIDGFGEDLSKHMADEIPSLLALKRYGDKVEDLWKAFGEAGQESMLSALPGLEPSSAS